MESKSHSRDTYKAAGQVSWMEQDLLDCSHDFKASFKQTPLEKKYSSLSRGKKQEAPHICVVGAGLAGLRCAEILIEAGVRVTILEARNRLGGRVCQADFLGHAVDMLQKYHSLEAEIAGDFVKPYHFASLDHPPTSTRGPNWIHGTFTNPILNLAKQTDTALCLIEDNTCVFDQNGLAISMEKAAEHFDLVWAIISDAFKYSNVDFVNISPKASLKDFFIEKIREKGLSKEDQALILQMAEMWGAFIGDPWDKQSLKYFWLEECLDGENLFVASNHAEILDSVAKSALNNAEIHLSTRVVGVESVDSTTEFPKVIIRTDDQEFEFDEAVVTVPLGCLKRQTPTFTPPLSLAITKAIQNTSYSRLEKVYITFPTAFWDSSSSTLEEIASEKTAIFKCFAHFLHPTYSPENPESWTLELNSLSSPEIFGNHAQPTLLFCIYGPCATHITSRITLLSPESADYFTAIDDFFRPYYALLPNYEPNNPHCRPRAVLATNWQNDLLAGCGSYMNFQVSEELGEGEAQVKLEDDLRALRWGMPERGIWLAGEHTAPFVALGTLTGAYWSGESAGMRILRAHDLVETREEKDPNGQLN